MTQSDTTARGLHTDLPGEQICQAIDSLAFHRHVGVKVVEVTRSVGRAQLDDADELRNHVGSLHAGAIFLVAEVAAGAAFVGAHFDQLTTIRFVARMAAIEYLASATGRLVAEARVREPYDPAAGPKARVHADSVVRDGDGAEVARLEIAYHVRQQ